MEKLCEHCGVLIEGLIRVTKKYCSVNCKQLAFYNRQGMNWGKNSGTQALPFNVKPDFTLNGNMEQVEETLQLVTMQEANDEAPEQDKETVTVKDFTISDKIADQDEVKLTNKAQQEKITAVTVKPDSVKPTPKEQYKWVSSPLIDAIANEREASNAEFMFSEPLRYWEEQGWQNVQWVSVRLRCLIANILNLSNERIVNVDTVLEISRAFTEMGESIYFKYIPRNYPFYSLVIELRDKFNAMAKCNSADGFSLKLSVKRKAELIAARFMMGDAIERKGFSELKFNDGIVEEVERKFKAQYPQKEDENDDD